MAEGPVGLGHLVGVLAPLHRRAEAVHGIDELRGELLAHALATALAGGLDEPAHAERQPAIAPDLHRDLVGGATDAARLDLDDRGRVAKGRLEDLEAWALRLELGAGQGLAQDPVGQRLLAVAHQLRAEAVGDAVRLLLVLRLAGDRLTARHLLLLPGRRGGLGAVLAAALLAVLDARRVEGAADDVVLHGREVLAPAASHQDHRVLLEVVADARDVGRDLHLVREPHARDLPKGRVRLLRGHRPDLQADAALLGGSGDGDLALSQAVPVLAQRGRLDLRGLRLPPVTHELADGRHGDAAPFTSLDGGGRPAGPRGPGVRPGTARSSG